MQSDTEPAARHDALTIAAVAVMVYSLSTLLHEAVGHGGACLLMHGTARELSSMDFDCLLPEGAVAANKLVAAAGTIATLAGGTIALLLYRRTPRHTHGSVVFRYALWLFATVNLMQGTGYFLFSGVGHIGDWADVTAGWQPAWLWRLGLAVLGASTYLLVTTRMFRALTPFTGDARPQRYEHARRLAILPYIVGGTLAIAAGAFNPHGVVLVLISGAAASLGGTSGLAWGPQMLRGPATAPNASQSSVSIVPRSWPASVLAALCAVAFVIVLGRGVTFAR